MGEAAHVHKSESQGLLKCHSVSQKRSTKPRGLDLLPSRGTVKGDLELAFPLMPQRKNPPPPG